MKIKALKNTTKTLKNLSDDQMFVGVLVIVSVIYVTLVVKSDNSNDRLLNFYSSPSGILFGTALIVVALAVNHASIKKMVPILGKYSKKTAILSGFVVFFNIFSLIYAGKVREDLLIPSGGELKYVDDEDGRVVKKKFQFTNADDVDFDDGESGGNTGGNTGGNSGDSDDDICEEGMNKKDIKTEIKKLKLEKKIATGERKEEVKRQLQICKALRDGDVGGGTTGGTTGGNSGDSDDDICEEGMNKKDIKTEIKKLKLEKKIATGERKEEVKRQLQICKALRDGDVGGGTTGGTTGGNSGGGGNTGGSDDDICEEGMTKKQLKKIKKKLKAEAKTATGEDKEEIKRQIKICRNLQRGGDGGNTGGDSSGSDDDICEEGMNKKDIKTEIKKLRAEKKIATGERKEEVKRQLNTCKALRDGDVGGGTTGGTTGGNSGDSDDDICEEGMNKRQIKTEIKKLRAEKKIATGERKEEVKRQLNTCVNLKQALKRREGFENYVNGENEDEDLNVVEKKLSNSCRKVVVDPDTTNISGADLGGDLFDLADFEKKVIV
jgi:hypothetical protein